MVYVHNGTATLYLERLYSRIPFELHLLLAGQVAKSLREPVSNSEVVRSLPKHYLCFLVESTRNVSPIKERFKNVLAEFVR